MISDAAFAGGVQVPPSGEPILLMSDRQTTGGYPQIAVVITADLPLAGQLAPGDWVEFVRCSRAEAIAALRDRSDARCPPIGLRWLSASTCRSSRSARWGWRPGAMVWASRHDRGRRSDPHLVHRA